MKAGTSIVRSVALTVTMRWTDRLIGVLSTIILARLLAPEDYGIVAQAYVLIGFTSAVLDLGVGLALIQKRDPTPDHYSTAWTMRIGQAACIGLVVFFGAPFVGDYFHEPRVVDVIRVLGAGILLGSFENIGVITFQKEMKFGLDFQFSFAKRMCSFIVTIALAAVWRSYWALVVGTLVGTAVGVVISYGMHNMRPRPSVVHFRELFAFSQWALMRGIGNYLKSSLDRVFVGRRGNTEIIGAYNVADEIAAMPSGELLAPLYRALFPAFVHARDDPAELKRIYLLAQSLQTMLVLPASAGLALVAPEIVSLFLGAKWTLAVPLLQVLALVEAGHALLTGSGYILLTMGRVRSTAVIAWVQVLGLVVPALIFFPDAGALDIARLRVFSAACGVVVAIAIMRGVLPGLRTRDVVANAWRPVLGTAVMATVIVGLNEAVQLSVWSALVMKVSIGVAVYVLSIWASWFVSGCPIGGETYAMEKLSLLWARIGPTR